MITNVFAMTSTLRTILHDPTTPRDAFVKIATMLDEVTTGLRQDFEHRQTILHEIHSVVDEAVETQKRRLPTTSSQITCRKGCAHCCKQIVAVSPIEASRLVEIARERQIPLDHDRLARQSGRDDQSWLTQPIEDQACVFLGADNLCQIYEHRPASCRKYFVISEPELCNIERHPHERTHVWFDIHAEVFTSAMFTAYGSGFLPDLLLAELGRADHEAMAHEGEV